MRPLALWLALGAATAASAQEVTDARRGAAEAYVASDGVQRSIEASVSAALVSAALDAQLGERLTEEERTEIARIVAEEMETIRPAIEEAMTEAAARTFSLPEMEALTAFHETPEGAAVLAKTQAFRSAYLEAVGPELLAATERAMTRAAELAQAQ